MKPLAPSDTVPAPLLCSVTVLPVAVRPALTAISPPYSVIGPATVVLLPIVMLAALPTLPRVRPLTELARARLPIGQVSGAAKLVLNGSIVRVPVVVAVDVAPNVTVSPM